jgi:hypothetical protein
MNLLNNKIKIQSILSLFFLNFELEVNLWKQAYFGFGYIILGFV